MAMMPGYTQSADHIRKRIGARLQTLKSKPLPVTRDWLYAHYILLGMDCTQLGRLLGKDAKTVWSWMRRSGVPTRQRGGLNRMPAGAKGAVIGPQERKPRLVDGVLAVKMYVAQEMSAPAIAVALGVSQSAVLRSLHSESVEMRGPRFYRARDGRLPFMKDGKHWLHHEGAKPATWRGGISPERQAFYASPEWKEACKAVWHRADAMCERCGTHHNIAAVRGTFHVHHIVSFMVRELRAAVDNLALLCAPCHRFVHSTKNADKQFIKEADCAGC